MFNRHPRKAVCFEMDQRDSEQCQASFRDEEDVNEASNGEEDFENVDQILERLMEIRERCHLNTKENIAAAQQKQKQQHDNKHNCISPMYACMLYIICSTEAMKIKRKTIP